MCHHCLILKNEHYCCSDRENCLRYIEESPDNFEDTVRKKFHEFSLRPNIPVIFDLLALLEDSDAPTITDVIMETFHFETENVGVFGLALHCLGLVRDPRAIKFLIERYDILSNINKEDLSPEMQAITSDHIRRAALSMINLIRTGRSVNPEAIPYIIKIDELGVLPKDMQITAIEAIKILANTHPIHYKKCLHKCYAHKP